MNHRKWLKWTLFLGVAILTMPLLAEQPDEKKPFEKKKDFGGFPGGGFGGPPMGQRRKLVDQFDKDGDGRLNADERAAAREFIKKQGGGNGFGKGPGGKGMKCFSPGVFIPKPLLENLDTDKDGKLAKAELLAGIKKFFADADKDKKGTLDETQLADALTRVMPQPGFPGGGGPK